MSNEKDDSIDTKLRRGEIVQVGNKLYRICPNCGRMIQINKFILGSLHECR